jgi:membrane-associated phospholipid phosphatase
LLEKIRNPFFDKLFAVITELGYELVALGVICIIFWCINKNTAYKIGFAYFASGMLIQGLKITFRVDRPWIKDPNFKPVGNAIEKATGYSFPSGHTQSATTLFGSLAIILKKTWAKVLCVVLFLLVGFSRNYLGVHYASDVIVSMLLSLICVFVFVKIFEKIENNKKYDWLVALVLIAVSVGVCVYSFVLKGKGIITEAKYVEDCCKTAGAGIGFAIGWFVERKWIGFVEKTPKTWHQIVKVIIGIVITLALKELPKKLFGDTAAVGLIRYMLVTLWVCGIYPFILKKVFNNKETE